MKNFLTPEIKRSIKNQALHLPEREVCGLITEYNEGFIDLPCYNFSELPEVEFIISKSEYDEISKVGKPVAFYHSHPKSSATPSLLDKGMAEYSKLSSVVYSVKDDKFFLYKPKNKILKYEGRPYYLGIFDCINLMRDYYKHELNINIGQFDHKLRFKNSEYIKQNYNKLLEELKLDDNDVKNSNPLKKFLEEQNFVEVNNLQKHDLILTKGRIKFPRGVLIYVGYNKILTHLSKRKSGYYYYNDLFRKRTLNIMRHRKLT